MLRNMSGLISWGPSHTARLSWVVFLSAKPHMLLQMSSVIYSLSAVVQNKTYNDQQNINSHFSLLCLPLREIRKQFSDELLPMRWFNNSSEVVRGSWALIISRTGNWNQKDLWRWFPVNQIFTARWTHVDHLRITNFLRSTRCGLIEILYIVTCIGDYDVGLDWQFIG
jgi:hypothetical protein